MICILDFQMLQKRVRLSCCTFFTCCYIFRLLRVSLSGSLSYAIDHSLEAPELLVHDKYCEQNHQNAQKTYAKKKSKVTQKDSKHLQPDSKSIQRTQIQKSVCFHPCDCLSKYVQHVLFSLDRDDWLTMIWKQFLFSGCCPYLKNIPTCYKKNQKDTNVCIYIYIQMEVCSRANHFSTLQ